MDETRTCQSCGTEETVIRRWFKTNWGWVVGLACGHFQSDDEH